MSPESKIRQLANESLTNITPEHWNSHFFHKEENSWQANITDLSYRADKMLYLAKKFDDNIQQYLRPKAKKMTTTSKKGAATLNNILSSVLNKRSWKQRVHIHSVFNFWNDVVGSDIAVHAQPDVIRDTVLWLKVSDQVWMHQLHLQKNMLLEILNGKLAGQVTVTDIRFQVDFTMRNDHETIAEISISPPPPEKVKEFEKLIDGLEDEKIKESLFRLWLSYESKLS